MQWLVSLMPQSGTKVEAIGSYPPISKRSNKYLRFEYSGDTIHHICPEHPDLEENSATPTTRRRLTSEDNYIKPRQVVQGALWQNGSQGVAFFMQCRCRVRSRPTMGDVQRLERHDQTSKKPKGWVEEKHACCRWGERRMMGRNTRRIVVGNPWKLSPRH